MDQNRPEGIYCMPTSFIKKDFFFSKEVKAAVMHNIATFGDCPVCMARDSS
jgi:hypothetical protein